MTRLASWSTQDRRTLFTRSATTTGLGNRSLLSRPGICRATGVGSINDAHDITATVQSTGLIAAGPSGLLQDLADLVSPAYAGSVLTSVGPMNSSGQILARMIIGQSGKRLVKLVPAQPCTSNCIQVTNIQMTGKGPAFCDQGSAEAQATLTVKNEAGVPLSGVRVTGHFFDDYWLDETVVGMTNANGQVKFRHVGPPCVGAIAFLVTDAESMQARTLSLTVAQRPVRSIVRSNDGDPDELRHPVALIGLGNYCRHLSLTIFMVCTPMIS